MDFFPKDFLLVIDESHATVPQVGAMFEGDRSRKTVLVEHGFRLPSARDNRPLRFEEVMQRVNQCIFLSATPSPYELSESQRVVEQIVRPTGLVDPEVIIRPTKGQIDDLLAEVQARIARNERTLITTLTKKMSEDLNDYLQEMGIRSMYLHSEIDTLERIDILRDLRLGVYDVLVGINLLREGLDLPEVSLVCILDADKEGYLRSGGSLIQTMGRAARHPMGKVIMYADRITDSMLYALDETERRRTIQAAYNAEHGVTPLGIQKTIRDIGDRLRQVAEEPSTYTTAADLPKEEITRMIMEIERQMKQAAKELDFERAALLRDQVVELRREQQGDPTAERLQSLSSQTRRPDKRAQRGGRSRRGHN